MIAVAASTVPALRTELKALLTSSLPGCVVLEIDPAVAGASAIEGSSPRLVCLDTDVAGTNGDASQSVVTWMRQHFPASALVIRGDARDPNAVSRARHAGAVGFIPRTGTARQQELIVALAWEGLHYFPQDDAPPESPLPIKIGDGEAEPALTDETYGLTPKELEVLACVASGMTNREVAGCLDIKEGTVKVHMTAILGKLEATSRSRAIVLALRMTAVRRLLFENARLGRSMRDWLLTRVTHRHFPPGEILFRRGEPGSDLYYLQSGTIRLEELGVDMGPGSVFGEVGAFSPNSVRTSTARCVTAVNLFCLDKDGVRSACYENPGFALHLMHLLAGRLAAERGL